ncbi:DUF1835 domain-containing protein [Paenibacillus sp. GXUN7292]|uniref:DUF1835 domain-containing protein n=1 Tax=Paenibacillus sp. GXUN7292 TaxID=3422499 RepID=UPI003D7E46F1
MDKRLALRMAIQDISSQDAKQLLTMIKMQLDIAERNKDAQTDLYRSLRNLYEKLLVPHNPVSYWAPNAATTKVHIVFGDSIGGSLKFAIRQLGYVDSNKIINFRDHFSIGPLWQLHVEAGRAHRSEWFKEHINDDNDEADCDDIAYYQEINKQIANIPAEASIEIWCGKNAHEQAGLRYAMYLLRNNSNKIYVFDVAEACEKKYNTADRSIQYLHTGEIPPDKLQAIYGEAKEQGEITHEMKRLLEHEWLSLANSDEVLRVWDGEKVLNVAADYLDEYLLETVEKLHAYKSSRDFIKAARVIGEAYGHSEQCISDGYYEYRLRQLIYDGLLEIKGVPRAMRYYSVRRKS